MHSSTIDEASSHASEGAQKQSLSMATGPVRSWLVWFLAVAFFFYGWVHRTAPSAMIEELMASFQVGAALLGTLAGLYFWAYAAMQLPVGMLVGRLGPRAILAAAAVVAGLGSLLFSVGSIDGGLWLAYLGRLMIGAGAGVSFVCVLALVATWFPDGRFGLFSGLTMLAGMLGGMVGQRPVSELVAAFGWQETLAAFGLAGIALAAMIWLIVRDRPPTSAGRDLPAPPPDEPMLRGMRRVLGKRQSWFAGLFGLCMSAQIFLFAGLWGVPYLTLAYGLDRADAATATSVILVCWGLGAPIYGALGDRTGRRRVLMLLGGSATTLLWLLLIFGPALPLWLTIVLFIPLGLAAGCMVLAYPLSRVHNPADTGAAMGFTNMMVIVAGAIFQPLTGWLLDAAWDGTLANGARVYDLEAYRTAFLLLPCAGIAAVLTALFVRDRRAEQVP